MDKTGWKITAIIFIIITILETLLIIWSTTIYLQEEKLLNQCYYDVCSENADAGYEAGVCACYDYDLTGELIVTKTKYMKD